MKTRILCWIMAGASLARAELVVKVEGIRHDRGVVRGLVFTKQDGFPNDHHKAAAKTSTKAKAGTVTLRFPNLDAKRGSIVILHDEDGDGKLKKNFLGIPREGLGTSKWEKRSRPKFQPTVVDLQTGKPVVIRVRYP